MPEPSDTVTIRRGALAALIWFFENSKDGFVAVEGDVVRRVNPVWTTLTGHPAESTAGASFWSFVLSEDAAALQAEAERLSLGAGVDREARIIARDGELIWVRLSLVRGAQPWLLAIVRDIRGQRELRQSEARFRGLVSATTDVVFRMSADWREALQIEGRGFVADSEGPTGSWLENYLLPEEHPRVQAAVGEAIADQSPFHLEVRVRRVDGSTGWAVSRAVPVRDEAGRIVEWFGAASDVTERRRAEEQLRLMVDELNHRVKNTLASIESIIHQGFRGAATLAEAEASLTARIVALAHATDLLTGDARAARSLRGVVEAALAAHSDLRRSRIRGRDLQLGARSAHALTLAVHELATNAVKHGALSTDDGGVDVSWQVEPTRGGRHLRLEWRERGGPPVSPPTRRGFGTRLIERSLSADEGAAVEFRFEPGGLVCVIDAPISS